MESYTIFDILRGAGRFLLSWKTDPEPARPSRMSVLFRVGVSHEINSEEKQPLCPAEASRKRRSHHDVGNTGCWGGKQVLMFSSVNNSLLKNRRKLNLLVLKGSYGRCQEKKLKGIHVSIAFHHKNWFFWVYSWHLTSSSGECLFQYILFLEHSVFLKLFYRYLLLLHGHLFLQERKDFSLALINRTLNN